MSTLIATALIRKLSIRHFRGLENFEWCPATGMNVVLGGGDVGKSTVLEAVALLLSPSNATVVSESDYWQRDSTQEFVIEAVMTLPADTGISSLHNFSWPWTWNGKDAVVPSASEADDMPAADDPVYRVRLRGTTELDLVWEIVQPHDAADHFSVSVRRKIGLVRLSADEKNDRDLRLVRIERRLASNAPADVISTTSADTTLDAEFQIKSPFASPIKAYNSKAHRRAPAELTLPTGESFLPLLSVSKTGSIWAT